MTPQAQKFHHDLMTLVATNTTGANKLSNREDVLIEMIAAIADVLGKTIPLVSSGNSDQLERLISVAQQQLAHTAVAACVDLLKIRGAIQ